MALVVDKTRLDDFAQHRQVFTGNRPHQKMRQPLAGLEMRVFEGAQRGIYKLMQLTTPKGDNAEVRAYPDAAADRAGHESKRSLFACDERRRGEGPAGEDVPSDLEAAIRRYCAEDDIGLVERSVTWRGPRATLSGTTGCK